MTHLKALLVQDLDTGRDPNTSEDVASRCVIGVNGYHSTDSQDTAVKRYEPPREEY
jgi:hypothetical protein